MKEQKISPNKYKIYKEPNGIFFKLKNTIPEKES